MKPEFVETSKDHFTIGNVILPFYTGDGGELEGPGDIIVLDISVPEAQIEETLTQWKLHGKGTGPGMTNKMHHVYFGDYDIVTNGALFYARDPISQDIEKLDKIWKIVVGARPDNRLAVTSVPVKK